MVSCPCPYGAVILVPRIYKSLRDLAETHKATLTFPSEGPSIVRWLFWKALRVLRSGNAFFTAYQNDFLQQGCVGIVQGGVHARSAAALAVLISIHLTSRQPNMEN